MHAFLVAWLVNIAALYLTAALIGDIKIKDFCGAALGALLLGGSTLLLRTLLHWLHLSFLTLDLVRFLIFAALFWLVGTFTPGFKVSGPGAAVVGAMLLLLLDWGLSTFAHLQLGLW